jgi:hypothetical protein
MPRMKLGAFVSVVLSLATLAACDNDTNNNPPADGPQFIVDSAPLPPDAFVCTLTDCNGVCTNTTNDPLNCNGCGMACQTGAACVNSACECAPNFLPASLAGNPLGQDMVIDQLPGAYVALTPFIASEIDAFGVGYPTTGVMLDTDITLDGTTLPNPPFAIAVFDIDIQTMEPQAAYAALSGTLNFTAACISGASGTLTNATFQAATIFPSPMLDPTGCTFDVAKVAFSIGDPTMCTPP